MSILSFQVRLVGRRNWYPEEGSRVLSGVAVNMAGNEVAPVSASFHAVGA